MARPEVTGRKCNQVRRTGKQFKKGRSIESASAQDGEAEEPEEPEEPEERPQQDDDRAQSVPALYRARGPPLDAFTIPEFCAAHRISRAHYYVLRARGLGPDEAELLGRVIITKEAAAAWRRKRTAAGRTARGGKVA
jgi:hypothetical protein